MRIMILPLFAIAAIPLLTSVASAQSRQNDYWCQVKSPPSRNEYDGRGPTEAIAMQRALASCNAQRGTRCIVNFCHYCGPARPELGLRAGDCGG
jgi:hypothetical protein